MRMEITRFGTSTMHPSLTVLVCFLLIVLFDHHCVLSLLFFCLVESLVAFDDNLVISVCKFGLGCFA